MKTRCPNCGATLSLDALIAHDDARAALRLLVQLARPLPPGANRTHIRPRRQTARRAAAGHPGAAH